MTPLRCGTRQHRRPADLVAVEVEDREHRAVPRGVQETDPLPRALQGGGLRFAIADDRDDDQIGVVERRAERVREDVPELSTLVNGSGRRDAHVTRDATRRGELPKQPVESGEVASHFGIDLRVRPLEIHVGDDRRAAVSRTGEIDHVGVVLSNEPVQVDVDQIQARRGPPVAEQPRLDVVRPERVRSSGLSCRKICPTVR